MKKLILSLAVVGSILFAGSEAMAQTNKNTNQSAQKPAWKKSTNGSWQGKRDGTTYWYKRDKNGTMTSSTDNKKWNNVSDNIWTDYDGRWYRIQGDNLEWSSNGGTTWSTAPNRYWRGSNGTWYGFDDNWTLWTGGSANIAPDFSTVNHTR